jgi:hypothetical protein
MKDDRATRQGNYYSAQISANDLSVLKHLIGHTVHRVYASCLQVTGRHLTAPSFSIPNSSNIEGQWVHTYFNFRCEWFETPHTLTDYWQVLVSHDDKPSDIELHPEKGLIAPCTIQYFHAAPINKFEVYEFQESAGEKQDSETVTYDKAILFHLDNGESFCIGCQLNGPGIATEVHISDDPDTIRTFLEGSRSRLSIVP